MKGAGWVLFLLAICAGVVGLVYVAATNSEKACERYGEVTGRQSNWEPRIGCMVKWNGQWIPQDEVKFRVKADESR